MMYVTPAPRTVKLARKVVVIGGGAAGLGAAGGAKAADPENEVLVFTQFEDVAYSPCGIPYVHGKEIPDFQSLFLADKQSYVDAGIDVSYESTVTAVDT
jgi:NADH oxidase (H2O2-forming)